MSSRFRPCRNCARAISGCLELELDLLGLIPPFLVIVMGMKDLLERRPVWISYAPLGSIP
jgi:hypothetical protein